MASSGLTLTAPHPFYVGSPEAGLVLQVEFHESRLSGVEGENPLPGLAGFASFDAAHGVVGNI